MPAARLEPSLAETPSFSDANYRHMLSGERISKSKHVPFFVTVNKLCAQRLDDIHEPHAHPQPSQHGTTHTLRYLSGPHQGPHTHTQRKESLASTRSNTLHTARAGHAHETRATAQELRRSYKRRGRGPRHTASDPRASHSSINPSQGRRCGTWRLRPERLSQAAAPRCLIGPGSQARALRDACG